MPDLSLSSAFTTFFAVVGPPKVLLAFAHLSRRYSLPEMRRLTLVSSAVAGAVGVTMAYAADHLTDFFHVSDQSLQLAGGVIFFIYAVALVMGIGLPGGEEGGHLANPLADGVRELMLPFVASPLAITAVLVESLEDDSWAQRTTVASMYLAVIAVDCVCALLLAPLLRITHQTSLEVLARLLGLLLAAVGVELFLAGLASLDVPIPEKH
ncbi:MarC family protein [Kitasatospora camelliae]|uniref:UPF0056 membrane protein n=1 Tax=Kitasatospora camelliae TaxID=3156397 RepID=A0AAU8JWD0_9ACTN